MIASSDSAEMSTVESDISRKDVKFGGPDIGRN